MRRRGKG